MPALAANAITGYDFASNASASEKYAPFNLVVISNTTSEPLEFYVNGNTDRPLRIPANVVKEYDKKSIPALRSVLIKNVGTGATSGSGDVVVEVQREVVDGESIISRVANKFINGAGV